jgi:3-oxoacyl-[acyl-carrier protein] reductase
MNGLEGKIVLVTAAAGAGIGHAVARRFAMEGARVVVTDRHEARTARVAEALDEEYPAEVIGIPLEVGDRARADEVVAQVISRFGRLDVLVNNAAVNRIADLHEMEPEEWDQIIRVCFGGAYDLTRAVLPSMYEHGWGAIVNVSSPASYNGGLAGEGAYSAAKAALQSLTRTVAIEGGPRGVRCNAVAPGIVWNDFGNLLRLCPQEFWDQRRAEIPMGRFGRPEEVASVVAFLASDDASYVSGETVVIGGGGWLQP